MVSSQYLILFIQVVSNCIGGFMKNNKLWTQGQMIKVNGIVLEVFEAGQENRGNPIVLCHGWPQLAFAWRHQIQCLVDEGYHVIVPNQRGYGKSSAPSQVSDYDMNHLSQDLIGLLDYYEYDKAIFMGHDWGATLVWGLALLHPERVDKIINLSVPYLERGPMPWIEGLKMFLGPDYYMVHFNEKPGVADQVFDQNTERFLTNMFRKNEPVNEPQEGMAFIRLAEQEIPQGQPIMSDADLQVFVKAFKESGFTGGINWYRNIDRNWHLLGQVDPIIHHKTLMVYGDKDPVQQFDRLPEYVPNVEVVTLDCGHWIQEEKTAALNQIVIDWLRKWKQ